MASNPNYEIDFLKSQHAEQLRRLNDSLDILNDIQERISLLGYIPLAEDLIQQEQMALENALKCIKV